MDELKELQRQRAEIDKRIAELLDRDHVVSGRAKLEKRHNPDGSEEYCVSVKASGRKVERANCWLSVITNATRDESVDELHELMTDMMRLYTQANVGAAMEVADPDGNV